MSTINASLEKSFYLRYVTIFYMYLLPSILNTFITVNFIWGHTFVMFVKNNQFYETLPPPHCSLRVPLLFTKMNNRYILLKTVES